MHNPGALLAVALPAARSGGLKGTARTRALILDDRRKETMRLPKLAGLLAAGAAVMALIALWAAARGVFDLFLWANAAMLAAMAGIASRQARAEEQGEVCPACRSAALGPTFCLRCGSWRRTAAH